MTIVRTRSGSWGYRFWHRGQLEERAGYPTKLAAQAGEWTRRGELGARGPRQAAGPPPIALADYIGQWLENIQPHVAPKTYRNYEERLRNHVTPFVGGIALTSLTRVQVRALLAARARAGQSRNSVRLIRAALSACLADAQEAGLVGENPCLGIDRGRRRRGQAMTPIERTAAVRPMSQEERDRFLAAAIETEPAWAAYFDLLAKTGVRPGEGLGLQVADVDWTAGTARIERSVVGTEVRPPKTHETRLIDLSPGLLEHLVEQRARARVVGLDLGVAVPWLFPNGAGQPGDLARAGKAFRRTLRAAAFEPGAFRLYDLRHTYACLRLAAGAPITYVAAQLGHATPATTLKYYARWIPSGGRAWVEEDRAERGRSVWTR